MSVSLEEEITHYNRLVLNAPAAFFHRKGDRSDEREEINYKLFAGWLFI